MNMFFSDGCEAVLVILDSCWNLQFCHETKNSFSIENEGKKESIVCVLFSFRIRWVDSVYILVYASERQSLLTLQLQPICCDHSDKCLHMVT